jgi:hypothetical protein
LWCLSHSHQTLNQASSWALPKTIQDTNLWHPNFSSPLVYKTEDNDGKPQSSDTEVSKLLGCTKDNTDTKLLGHISHPQHIRLTTLQFSKTVFASFLICALQSPHPQPAWTQYT